MLLRSLLSFEVNLRKRPHRLLQIRSTILPNNLDSENKNDISNVRKKNPATGEYSFELWSKAFESQPNEFNYEFSEIEGEIPISLKGTFFRVMPALFERGGVSYGHYLDGKSYFLKCQKNLKCIFR